MLCLLSSYELLVKNNLLFILILYFETMNYISISLLGFKTILIITTRLIFHCNQHFKNGKQ